MPDRGEPEAPVEAPVLLQRSGQQRAEERAEVDAEVEEREAGVAARVVLGVQRADHGGRVRLQPAAAERDQHQADADADESRDRGERDVARHDHDGAVEQHALGAEQPVGQPGAEDRREVDQAAVRADDAGGGPSGRCPGRPSATE